jgi:hypothetical protein
LRTAKLWAAGYRYALEERKTRLSADLEKRGSRDAEPDPGLASELNSVTVLLAASRDLLESGQLIEAYYRHLRAKPTLTEKLVQDQIEREKTIAGEGLRAEKRLHDT